MLPQEDEITFTLSIGGVEFCLASTQGATDDNASKSNVMSISELCNGEVLINLNNFVGTLRVRNHKNSTATTRSCSALLDTKSLIRNEHLEDDVTVEASSPANTEDKCNVAPMVTIAPTAVEDTPSPQPKIERSKQLKGQQKLFFGEQRKKQANKNEEKKRSKKNETGKPSTTSEEAPTSKRSLAQDKLESVTMKKKPRKSNKSNKRVPTEDISQFNYLFDEDVKEGLDNIDKNSFTLANLGQDMPSSQENESSEYDTVSLETTEMESNAAGDKHSKAEPLTEQTFSIVSKKSGHEAVAPCPRWGHTMTMIDHKRFIVYGGQLIGKDSSSPTLLSDLFVYDLLEHRWNKPINCDGIARTWHTADFLPERQLLLCFGGEVLNENTAKLMTTNQLMVLDCEIMLWYPPMVSGHVPSGRSGHASCVLPITNELVVFGGVKNGKWLNSTSILDTHRWKWNVLKAVGDAPPPRSYHSATAISTEVGNRVIIFGGNNGSRCFNAIHVLESTWEGKKWVWSHPKCKGDVPSPRTGHIAMLLNDGSTILVYGGWDPNAEDQNGDDKVFGDSYLLDTKMWSWQKGPNPRYVPSAKINATNGGAERVGHSAVLAPASQGVQVLAFGGRVPENKFASDLQSLTTPL